MAVLFRIFLIGLLIYLIFHTFASFGARTRRPGGGSKNDDPIRKGDKKSGVPKDIGEYVDYEEVNDD